MMAEFLPWWLTIPAALFMFSGAARPLLYSDRFRWVLLGTVLGLTSLAIMIATIPALADRVIVGAAVRLKQIEAENGP